MKVIKNKIISFIIVILGIGYFFDSIAQSIGIGNNIFTPDASAMLEVRATNRGVLIPRVALTSVNDATTIPSPATSLLVYNTGSGGLSPAGYYYNAGTPAAPNWVRLITRGDAWLVDGNAGTNPASNFLGTTDNQHMVIRTNNTERMRILNNGQVLINTTTAVAATDLFDAVGNATYPDVINGYAIVDGGIGVYGQNATAGTGAGAGVYGYSVQTGSAGVVGDGATSTRGVAGITNNATYAAVQAQQINANGDGLFAYNSAANGTGSGSAIWAVSGQTGGATIMAGLRSNSYFAGTTISAITDQSITGGRAILAECSNTTGVSIQGQTSGTQAIAILGINSSTTANTAAVGVQGQTSNPAGKGVVGINNSTTGNVNAAGVLGQTTNPRGAGLLGINNSTIANSDATGVWGQTSNPSGSGVIGAGNGVGASYLANGSGGAFTGSTIGIAAFKNGNLTDGQGAGYFIASTTSNVGVYVAHRQGGTNYKIIDAGAFGGSVSTDVWGLEGKKDRRVMFAPEATEIFLQDYGRGQLVNGKAVIKLDPIFAKNIIVNDSFPLHVYIQLEGDCKGVYVTNKTNESFEVRELQGGTSNVPFTYFVTGHRRDYIDPETGELISKHQGVRLPLAPEPLPILQMSREKTITREISTEEPIERINKQEELKPVKLKKIHDHE